MSCHHRLVTLPGDRQKTMWWHHMFKPPGHNEAAHRIYGEPSSRKLLHKVQVVSWFTRSRQAAQTPVPWGKKSGEYAGSRNLEPVFGSGLWSHQNDWDLSSPDHGPGRDGESEFNSFPPPSCILLPGTSSLSWELLAAAQATRKQKEWVLFPSPL